MAYKDSRTPERSAKLPTLLEAAQTLNDVERAHLASIMVTCGGGGYEARFSISLYLPHATEPDLPEGVHFAGIWRYPDIYRTLEWRIPIWDQVLELICHPALTRPEEFGSMEATEKALVLPDGAASQTEADRHWIVVTHGAPRSPERREWIERLLASPYSATLGARRQPT